jgi:endonuclease YncB( thermonuclease family)
MHRWLFLLCLLPSTLLAEEAIVRVVNVHSADTIVVLHDGKAETIRLKGIDCSESSVRAKKYATNTIGGKNLTVKTDGKDKYGRTLADLFLENGNHFNRELVRTGHCRWGRSRAMRK